MSLVMREPPSSGNRELQELIWGAYKQVQRLRSQWPPGELKETLPALEGADRRTAGTRLVERIQEHLRSVQRDLEALQRVLQEEQLAAEARSSSEKLPGLSIGSTSELFEAVRLGIVDIAEARPLLGLAAKEVGGTSQSAQAVPDQTPLTES
jgi:hypothetical protein